MTKNGIQVDLPRHRAHYVRERGIWRATCQVCGWEVADQERRQASSIFRQHIRESREIDVEKLSQVSVVQPISRGVPAPPLS